MTYGKQRWLGALLALLCGVLLPAQAQTLPGAPSTQSPRPSGFCDFARNLGMDCPGNRANLAQREERERQRRYVTLARGTPIHLRLTRSYSSREHRPGESVELRVTDPVRAEGVLVLPRGAIVWGYVDAGTRKDGFCMKGESLHLSSDHAEAITGEIIPLVGGVSTTEDFWMRSEAERESPYKLYCLLANRGVENLLRLAAIARGIRLKGSNAVIPVDTPVEAYVERDVTFDLEAATQVAIRLGYLNPEGSSMAADQGNDASKKTKVELSSSQGAVPRKEQP